MMNKRVYGVMGVSSIMANWNADFSGYPRITSKGDTFGSDKAFKYPMKKMWEENGEKVIYLKSMMLQEKDGEISFIPRTLIQRYQQLFNTDDMKDQKKILNNLFSAIDVRNFGATFLYKVKNKKGKEDGKTISITGAVQFGQGFNKYEETVPHEMQILSPVLDPTAKEKKGEDAKQTSIGTKIVSDEAHYFYPFSINPKAYKEFVELGVTDGYTEEDYLKFKKAALSAATSFATNAKAGCENEFGIFVETTEDTYLPNLAENIQFEHRKNDKNAISVQCGKLLNELGEKILNVEIYYNPYTTTIKTDISSVNLYDIFTGKELQ